MELLGTISIGVALDLPLIVGPAREAAMRIESSVTSLSWIPLGAVEGFNRLTFGLLRVAHFDPPPPEVLGDLDELQATGRFRFANRLEAWIQVQDGCIVDAGQSGGGRVNVTRVGYGSASIAFTPVVLPDLRSEPEIGPTRARFVQTAGGQTGFPTPRRVRHEPYVQLWGPATWSTLALTIHADGRSEARLIGASSFPRHWVYNHGGRLVAKSGFIDYDAWWREAFGTHTPWGAEDSAPVVTAVESALERHLSVAVIDAKPRFLRLQAGRTLVQQGERGDELFLLFDGVLRVEVDGKPVTEVGPGAILGEMALLHEGRRMATLRAVTPCRVAVVPKDRIDRQALEELAKGHAPPRPLNGSPEACP
jgi:Cyclic nucleotide-binding domain